MDTAFYSDETVENFIRDTMCQGDEKLFNHYKNIDAAKFRERISRKFSESADKNIEQVVYTCVTDCIRDLILKTIGDLTVSLKSAGDLIVTGGEAFNMYFDRDHRIITSDIDTKFVPARLGFSNLQAIKLKIWYLMGLHAKKLNEMIKNRLKKFLSPSVAGKLLGIRFPTKGPWVTRRYTLIPKMRQKLTTNAVTLEDVLIDVELFALDLNICYYSVSQKKVKKFHLGGILDMALMRPNEMGYEVGHDRNQGVMYLDKTTNKMKTDKRILFAGKRFLVEDVYLMQLLGLRPNKIAKDRKRLYQFSTSVLGVKNIRPGDSLLKIFKAAKNKLSPLKKSEMRGRPKFVPKKFNPEVFKKFTTVPQIAKIARQFSGIKGTTVELKNFARTSGKYRFNQNRKVWITNNSINYIKNEMNLRPTSTNIKKFPEGLKNINTLYGYRGNRNGVPTNILRASALIPFIGLKKIPVEIVEK